MIGSSLCHFRITALEDTPPTVTEIKPELPRHRGRVIGRKLLARHASGDPERVEKLLTEARASSESMGMHGQVEWTDALVTL